MSNQGVVLAYVVACVSGVLGTPECGPVWQLGLIAALLLVSIVTLAVLQLRRLFLRKA